MAAESQSVNKGYCSDCNSGWGSFSFFTQSGEIWSAEPELWNPFQAHSLQALVSADGRSKTRFLIYSYCYDAQGSHSSQVGKVGFDTAI